MQFLTQLQNLVRAETAAYARVIDEYGLPIPEGMLTPSKQGDLRPLVASEIEQWLADNRAIIEHSRKTLEYYQSAYNAECERLLS